MAKGILLPAVWVLGALLGPQAAATSSKVVGIVDAVDVRARVITLRGGMQFTASSGVKLSTRQPGEEVVVIYQAASNGLIAIEVRPVPVLQQSFMMPDEPEQVPGSR